MKKIKALAIFNGLSLLIHIGFAWLTQAKMINTKDTGEVSAQFNSLFTPAGFTFAIWGVIYTILAVLCLFHIVIAYKHDKSHSANTDLERMGGWFILVNLASAGWLYVWTHEAITASLVLIAFQLIALITIHIRLHIYDRFRPAASKLCTQFPLSIYLGWISIATIANASIYLVHTGWDGLGLPPEQWTLIMIAAAVLLALLMIFTRRNIYFGLVVVWGLYGIISKLESALNPEQHTTITTTAWMGLGVVLLACVIQWINNITKPKPKETFPAAHASLK